MYLDGLWAYAFYFLMNSLYQNFLLVYFIFFLNFKFEDAQNEFRGVIFSQNIGEGGGGGVSKFKGSFMI